MRIALTQAFLASVAIAAPAPQVPGYSGADADVPPAPTFTPPATVFGPDRTVPAVETEATYTPPLRSSIFTGPTYHGPYSGTPTTTGALSNNVQASSIAAGPPNPSATYYNAQGVLFNPQPAPYVPAGGLGTNGSQPRYMVESDFDFQSLALALYQEWIELDLFNNGLAIFSAQDFMDAGLTAEDRAFIAFMAQQEIGHASLISNMLGEAAPPQCTYNYPYTNVREFVDFNQKLTRFGESGVLGFQPHLDSREVAGLLGQSIHTEARQQMAFRQMLGLHPMPVWFETGIPQSWAWTYLAPYISSCPENTTRLVWQNFPALHIVNQPNPNRFSPNDTLDNEVTGDRVADPSNARLYPEDSCVNVTEAGYSCAPGISRNRSEPLSFPGKQVNFTWEQPGQPIGPNMSYVTSSSAGTPQYVAWVSQFNLTYTPLTVTGDTSGYTYQPASYTYDTDPAVNGTMFVALTDSDMVVTPFNLSMLNPHVAALGLYQAG